MKKPNSQTLNAQKSEMPLNKYLSNCGVASRREAVNLIKAGKVSVDGVKITNPAHRVTNKNDIVANGYYIAKEDPVYLLLNKPKNCITTLSDEKGRKSVKDIVDLPERIFPVGRLDRATTGVLLMTNDGTLSNRLIHPSYNIEKKYSVNLDKPLTHQDLKAILKGVRLEDGIAKVDSIQYGSTKEYLDLTIHSGKNRIIRRIFASLGYTVKKLDRVSFAFLNTKGLRQGQWRLLKPEEVKKLYKLVKLD